jgi:hypothetical protein
VRRSSPLQRALDRRDGGIQHGCDLGGMEGEHLPQHEDGPLPGGQILQPADEWSRRLSRAATIVAGSGDSGTTSVSGIGCTQATPASGRSDGLAGSSLGLAEAGRQRLPAALFECRDRLLLRFRDHSGQPMLLGCAA